MRRLGVVLGIVVVLAGGCGESGGSGSASGSASVSGSASGSGAPEDPPVALSGKVENKGIKDATGGGDVDMELDDFYFGPTFLKVKAGQSLKLNLHNEGKAAHTFTTAGVDETVQPGEKKTVTVTGPASGAVVFSCRFHQAQGMQGAMYLKDGDKVEAGGTTSSTGAGGYGY